MKQEFKVGDKVYFPFVDGQIYTLKAHDGKSYPLAIESDSFFESFTLRGYNYADNHLPSIFHATPETQRLLEQLHGIKLEDAPVKPTSREIIQAKLDGGKPAVPCWVSDIDNQPSVEACWAFVAKVIDGNFSYKDTNGIRWEFATPFDPDKCEAITELPK